jgi:hypothetical protein
LSAIPILPYIATRYEEINMTTSNSDFTAREALRLLGPDPENWVPDRPGIDHNFTIIGGRGSGSTFVFALRRAGISRVTAIDAADDEAHAGVWLT